MVGVAAKKVALSHQGAADVTGKYGMPIHLTIEITSVLGVNINKFKDVFL